MSKKVSKEQKQHIRNFNMSLAVTLLRKIEMHMTACRFEGGSCFILTDDDKIFEIKGSEVSREKNNLINREG